MKRRPIIRTAPMRRAAKRLTAQDRRDYHAATERARNADGFICCEICSRPLLDRDAERHHVQKRSAGGKNNPENLLVVCRPCHSSEHHIRVIER